MLLFNTARLFKKDYSGISCKGQGKIRPTALNEGKEGEEMFSSTLPLNSALGGSGWNDTPRPLYPRE